MLPKDMTPTSPTSSRDRALAMTAKDCSAMVPPPLFPGAMEEESSTARRI